MPPNLEIPKYSRRELNSDWYHTLYGQVPGVEQDPLLEPELDDELNSRHVSNLAQYMTALAPMNEGGIGLTFANLSRTVHEHQPGRGGVAIIMSLRARRGSGTRDHAGREGPLIKHALVAINRHLDHNALHLGALSLFHHAIGIRNAQNPLLVGRTAGPIDSWYREYLDLSASSTAERKQSIMRYTRSFDLLPALHASPIPYQYVARQPPNKLIYIEYSDNLSYFELVGYASELCAALYISQMSDLPWAVVELGTRGYEVFDGIAIRFVPKGFLRPNEAGYRIDLSILPPPSASDCRQRLHELFSQLFNATAEPLPRPGVTSSPMPLPADAHPTPQLGVTNCAGSDAVAHPLPVISIDLEPGTLFQNVSGLPDRTLESERPTQPGMPQPAAGTGEAIGSNRSDYTKLHSLIHSGDIIISEPLKGPTDSAHQTAIGRHLQARWGLGLGVLATVLFAVLVLSIVSSSLALDSQRACQGLQTQGAAVREELKHTLSSGQGQLLQDIRTDVQSFCEPKRPPKGSESPAPSPVSTSPLQRQDSAPHNKKPGRPGEASRGVPSSGSSASTERPVSGPRPDKDNRDLVKEDVEQRTDKGH